MIEDRVQIALATFESGRFLREQVESILQQSHENIEILARDDGSTDDTAQLLDALAAQHPDRLSIVRDSLGNLGPIGNFGHLLALSTAPYVMFADADDVWLRRLHRFLRQREEKRRAREKQRELLDR